jgi:hypothetical protein
MRPRRLIQGRVRRLNAGVRRDPMPSLPSTVSELLLSYVGPEPERVRKALALLARNDVDLMRHYLEYAAADYRFVLWWAELQLEMDEPEQGRFLGLKIINERLSHLGLLSAWDAAIAARDILAARALLSRCGIPKYDAAQIVEAIIDRV